MPSGIAEELKAEIGRTSPRFSRSAFLTLLALTVLYAVLIASNFRRHLWFDELLTLHIAQAQSLSQLFSFVKAWDLNPPLLHLLAHASLALTGGNPLAIRIPSVLEFYFASVFLFCYSWQKLGKQFAPLPLLILWSSSIFRFATEARPYAALCFWFCALLLVWDHAVSRRPRKLLLAGVAVSSAGLLMTHVFGPLTLLAFFAAEAVRWMRRRVPDYPLWAALFLPLGLVLSYLPFVQSYRTITDYPVPFQAGFDKVISFYWHTCASVLACVAVAAFAGWIVSRFAPRASAGVSMQPVRLTRPGSMQPVRLARPERMLWITLAIVPVLLDLILMSERSPFWGRYCITSAVALYFLLALLLASVFRRRPRAGYAAVSAAGALLVVQGLAVPLYANRQHPVSSTFPGIEAVHPDLPLVTASGLTFVEMGYYERPATRARLFYLLDRAAAIEFAHATIFEDMGEFQRAFQLPGTVESYNRFTQDHKDFLVTGTPNYPEDWLLRKLSAERAQITSLGTYATPYKDKSLFKVHLER